MINFINAIKSRLFLNVAFIISLASIFFTASITYKHILELNKSSDLVMKSYEVKLNLERLISELKDAETGFRGFLLYKDRAFLEPFQDSRENAEKAFYKVKSLTREDEIQQKNLKELYRLIVIRYSYFNENFEETKKEEYRKYYVYNSKKTMDKIRSKVKEMNLIEEALLNKRQAYFEDTSFYTPIYALFIVLITLFFIIVAYVRINNDLINLRKSNNRLKVKNESQKLAETIGKFGSWEINLDKKFFYFSENLYRLLGYEPFEFEPNLEEYLKTIHPDDLEFIKQKTQKILEEKELPSYTYRIIKKNGEIRFFHTSGIFINNSFGEKLIVGSTQDVTEQQEYTERIRKSNEELIVYNKKLTIYDESSKQAEILGNYGSWILNFETLQFSYSDNKFRLLGCEPQSFIPSIDKLIEFTHPDDKEIIINGYKNIIENENLPAINYRIIRKDGVTRNFRTTAKMYIDSLGTKNMIGTTQDITDDVTKAQVLKQKNQELERSNKELIEFNYAASHDLQEPLRKIQTFISRLKEIEIDNISVKGKEYLFRIENSATRMRILIDDLLQYSRTNKSDELFETINLNTTFKDVTQDLSEIISENNTIIKTSKLPVIKGIPFQINQLFVNLISNSIKYRKPDVNPIIKITYEKVNGKNENIGDEENAIFHKIVISDNGIGFDQEHAEKIFLLFNRLHGKTEYPGTGVGLAICKKIISNHNGHIFATGEPNKGSRFFIYLPE